MEFDEFGHFHDDWEHIFHDPSGVGMFLSSVIDGCHDLVLLEEYADAFEILDKVLRLHFAVTDHPDTDDSWGGDYADLSQLERERIVDIQAEEVLSDYVSSCRYAIDDPHDAAQKIVTAFEMDLFENCEPRGIIVPDAGTPLLKEIKKALAEELEEAEKTAEENRKADRYYIGEYRDKQRISRIKYLQKYFGEVGAKQRKPVKSFLRGTWSQIEDLICSLEMEPYIDDQFEIEEIWDIVEALKKRGGFEQEPWEVKAQILSRIYSNDYFNDLGIYDPMYDLSQILCSGAEENLKRADIMMASSYNGTDAARLGTGRKVKERQIF